MDLSNHRLLLLRDLLEDLFELVELRETLESRISSELMILCSCVLPSCE